MDIVLELIIVLAIGSVFCFFMIYRIEWVYKVRAALLDSDYEKYKRMKSYDYMMWHFWCWNAMSFVDDECDTMS